MTVTWTLPAKRSRDFESFNWPTSKKNFNADNPRSLSPRDSRSCGFQYQFGPRRSSGTTTWNFKLDGASDAIGAPCLYVVRCRLHEFTVGIVSVEGLLHAGRLEYTFQAVGNLNDPCLGSLIIVLLLLPGSSVPINSFAWTC